MFTALVASLFRKKSLLTGSLAAVFVWSFAVTPQSHAGHPIANGDCWNVSTPLICRTNWQGPDLPLYIRIDDQLSSARPHLGTAINAAISSWTNANGPQQVSKAPIASPETWTYLYDSVTGQHALTSNSVAITWICTSSGYCTYTNTSMNIFKANIFP